jgi:amino acid permease
MKEDYATPIKSANRITLAHQASVDRHHSASTLSPASHASSTPQSPPRLLTSRLSRNQTISSDSGLASEIRPIIYSSTGRPATEDGEEEDGDGGDHRQYHDRLDSADSFLSSTQMESKSSMKNSVLALVNSVVGAGVLGFPFCFKTCGLMLAAVLVLITLIASEVSMHFLLLASQITERRSYESLAFAALGGAMGQRAVEACIIVMNAGALVAFLNILCDVFSLLAGSVVPPGAEPSRTMTLILVTFMCGIPVVAYSRNPRILSLANRASMAFMLVFCLAVSLMALFPLSFPLSSSSSSSSFSNNNYNKVIWWDNQGILVSFPVIVYGFTAHQILFSILSSLRSPNLKQMTTVVQKSMYISSAIYLIVGACGYLAFGHRTSGDILRNLGGSSVGTFRFAVERILKIGYGTTVLLTMPLILGPLLGAIRPWTRTLLTSSGGRHINGDVNDDTTTSAIDNNGGDGHNYCCQEAKSGGGAQDHVLAAGVLGLAAGLALKLPNLEHVFGLAGSTASVLVAFVFPAAIFLRTTSSIAAGYTSTGSFGFKIQQEQQFITESHHLQQQNPALRTLSGSLSAPQNWKRQRKMAIALLLFGLIAGVACTRALIVAIREEAEVVELVQELVKEEKKVAAAVEATTQAKHATAAVGAVAKATEQLHAMQTDVLAEVVEEVEVEISKGQQGSISSKGDSSSSSTTISKQRDSSSSQTTATAKDIKDEIKAVDTDMEKTAQTLIQVNNILKSAIESLISEEKQELQEDEEEEDNNLDDDDDDGILAKELPDRKKKKNRKKDGIALTTGDILVSLEDVHKRSVVVLSKVQESKAVLYKAQQEMNNEQEVQAALEQALTSVKLAVVQVNMTIVALTTMQLEKANELAALVNKLLDEDKKTSSSSSASLKQQTESRKQAAGQGKITTTPLKDSNTISVTDDKKKAPQTLSESSVQAAEQVLKKIADSQSGGNGDTDAIDDANGGGKIINDFITIPVANRNTTADVSQMAITVAKTAMDIASDVSKNAAANAERRVEEKSDAVTTRAIEAAKELVTPRKNNTESAIAAAEVKNEQLKATTAIGNR